MHLAGNFAEIDGLVDIDLHEHKRTYLQPVRDSLLT